MVTMLTIVKNGDDDDDGDDDGKMMTIYKNNITSVTACYRC